jgi:hypothetical protein
MQLLVHGGGMMPSQERVTPGQPFTRDIIFIFIDL